MLTLLEAMLSFREAMLPFREPMLTFLEAILPFREAVLPFRETMLPNACAQCISLTAMSVCLQLPQVESDGQELNGRRFRVENGESLGEREEVSEVPLHFAVVGKS
jgi:hypothetical protein